MNIIGSHSSGWTKSIPRNQHSVLSDEIRAYAESFPDIRAGIARLKDVFTGASYHVELEGKGRTTQRAEKTVMPWSIEAQSVLVLGLKHPKAIPDLDWWDKGNTRGNRTLMEMSEQVIEWLQHEQGLHAVQVPYHVEKGGLFLKDAAVFAGLGVVGRNNLLLHPIWGAHVRLRAIVIEEHVRPHEPLKNFSPCEACDTSCHTACPMNAFPDGHYNRSNCQQQMSNDEGKTFLDKTKAQNRNKPLMITYCRNCEFICPVGNDREVS